MSGIPRKKNVVQKGGLLGEDIIVHSETRSFRGVLDAAVNSPLARGSSFELISLSLCFFDPFFPTVMRTFGNVMLCISNFLKNALYES